MTWLHAAAISKKSRVWYWVIIVGRGPWTEAFHWALGQSGRDVKRVHEDVQVLTSLGLAERDEAGGVLCPFADVHIDMHVHHESVVA